VSREKGYTEYREKCLWCESVRCLRGEYVKRHLSSTAAEGNILVNGYWELERTGFKCSGHQWKSLVTGQTSVKNKNKVNKYAEGELTW
jgi:hypothetical protein